MARIYTDQEMREMAEAIIKECTDEENGLVYESRYRAGHIFYPEEAAAMLQQAAKMCKKGRELRYFTKSDITEEKYMTDKSNALTELAKELYQICMHTTRNNGLDAIAKAQRIIAELAKASDAIGYADEFAKDGCEECIYIPATQQLCVKKILKCREIAEEGGAE